MKKQMNITFLGIRDKNGVMHDPDHLPREFIDAVVDMFINAQASIEANPAGTAGIKPERE